MYLRPIYIFLMYLRLFMALILDTKFKTAMNEI